jgi:hypothetical protein
MKLPSVSLVPLCNIIQLKWEFRFSRRRGLITLMMEAVSTSETSFNFYETTRYNNPEGCPLHHPISLSESGRHIYLFLFYVLLCHYVLLFSDTVWATLVVYCRLGCDDSCERLPEEEVISCTWANRTEENHVTLTKIGALVQSWKIYLPNTENATYFWDIWSVSWYLVRCLLLCMRWSKSCVMC